MIKVSESEKLQIEALADEMEIRGGEICELLRKIARAENPIRMAAFAFVSSGSFGNRDVLVPGHAAIFVQSTPIGRKLTEVTLTARMVVNDETELT